MTNTETPRFTQGQRVRIIANAGGLYSAQIGVVGVIARKRQYRRWGYHTYDVDYQDAKGREKRVTSVREDDLEAVEAVEAEAAVEPTPAQTAKAAELPPKFSRGEHVTVDRHSALAYEAFTRGGAVGVIVGVGTPVRGIRRYDVRYAADTPAAQRAVARNRMGLLPLAQIREEHLLLAEPPAPREYATARHAYEYREKYPSDYHLWCDAGGSFIEACAVCRAHEGDTLTGTSPTPQVGCVRRGTHDWQVWPDGRYRHCVKCKANERIPAQESEVAHAATD